MADHKEAQIFELNNGTMKVLVSNYGCTITSLFIPDKHGILFSFFLFSHFFVLSCVIIMFVIYFSRKTG